VILTTKTTRDMLRPLSLLLLLLLPPFASATEERSTSKLVVHVPHKLHRPGGYDHREALFGIPQYGGSISQNVFWADSTLCSPNDYSFSNLYPHDTTAKEYGGPFILMVNRGGCTFVTKVRNAQRWGAAAVLIADDSCLCDDEDCKRSNPGLCENREPTMADDGSGGDISIPSFLMFKVDADLIKDELRQNRPVQMEMAWSLPAPGDQVQYDLWTVPSDPLSKGFLGTFSTVAKALGNRAQFTPHFYIFDGKMAGCVGGLHECARMCTNYGRYCATDPDGGRGGSDDESSEGGWGISGADIVAESLRRLCVWKHYGEQNGIGTIWWDYVRLFQEDCDVPDRFTDHSCIHKVFRKAGVEPDKMDYCIKNSGGLDKDADNAFLELEIESRNKMGIFIVPTATVNNMPIRGSLTPHNVFDAICAGYAPGTTPDLCHQCAHCSQVMECIETGGKKCYSTDGASGGLLPGNSRKVSTPFFLFTMFVVVCGFTAGGIWYYKRTKDEMRDHVRGILAEYMPLEDQEQQQQQQQQQGGMMGMMQPSASGFS